MTQASSQHSRREKKIVERERSKLLLSRLERELRPLANRFLETCNSGTPSVIEPRSASTPFGDKFAKYYGSLRVRYFTISPGWPRFLEEEDDLGNKMFDSPMTVGRNETELGAVTYNRCIDGVYLCWPAVAVLLMDDLDFAHIEWARLPVQPRCVFFRECELGNESRYLHDIIIIHARSGARFVFDPTGYQFGFDDWLFRWEDYRRRFAVGAKKILDVDVEELSWRKGASGQKLSKGRRFRKEVMRKTKDEIKEGFFWG